MKIDNLVQIALAEVGTREEGGNNCGKDIREYQAATWLEPGPWPWCAAFVAWCIKEWLKGNPDMSITRCMDASAFGWEKWAKKQGLQILPETAKAKAGDLVIFDFSHIGIVVADQIGNTIRTCEGNTNGKGERDSASGDGVWLKTRAQSLTKCYIRLSKVA